MRTCGKRPGFGRALVNSLYVAGASTICTLFIAVPMAYALARYKFRAKNFVSYFLLVTQMLSPIVLVVGLFKLIAYLGLIDQAEFSGFMLYRF